MVDLATVNAVNTAATAQSVASMPATLDTGFGALLQTMIGTIDPSATPAAMPVTAPGTTAPPMTNFASVTLFKITDLIASDPIAVPPVTLATAPSTTAGKRPEGDYAAATQLQTSNVAGMDTVATDIKPITPTSFLAATSVVNVMTSASRNASTDSSSDNAADSTVDSASDSAVDSTASSSANNGSDVVGMWQQTSSAMVAVATSQQTSQSTVRQDTVSPAKAAVAAPQQAVQSTAQQIPVYPATAAVPAPQQAVQSTAPQIPVYPATATLPAPQQTVQSATPQIPVYPATASFPAPQPAAQATAPQNPVYPATASFPAPQPAAQATAPQFPVLPSIASATAAAPDTTTVASSATTSTPDNSATTEPSATSQTTPDPTVTGQAAAFQIAANQAVPNPTAPSAADPAAAAAPDKMVALSAAQALTAPRGAETGTADVKFKAMPRVSNETKPAGDKTKPDTSDKTTPSDKTGTDKPTSVTTADPAVGLRNSPIQPRQDGQVPSDQNLNNAAPTAVAAQTTPVTPPSDHAAAANRDTGAVPAVAVNPLASNPPKIAADIQVTAGRHGDDTSATLDKLAVTIAAKSLQGLHQFDIRLDPPDLGRVQVKLTVDDGGQAQASLVVDKPQTLDLLQRDSSSLNRVLTDAGLNLSNNGLSFSLRDSQQQADGGTYKGRNRNLSVKAALAADSSTIRSTSGSYAPNSVRLDIRV